MKGNLVLPRGSPGYGIVTHVKPAGHWNKGGDLTFSVTHLIEPDGTSFTVATTGPIADADAKAEVNGNIVGQYLLFGGVGLLARKGNDMVIKLGTTLHVITTAQTAPIQTLGVAPAKIDPTLIVTAMPTPNSADKS